MQIRHALRLIQQTCALRHLSIQTEKTYTHWVGRYGSFLRDHELESAATESKIEVFLTRLAQSGVSAATQNQAFNAVLFFYRDVLKRELGPINALRAKRPDTIRQCPTPEEVRRLLATVGDVYSYPTRLIVHLLYACGLRVTEPLNLRIKDLDLGQGRLYIYQAKGNQGRVVPCPACLAEPLQRQLLHARRVARHDRVHGIPVALPGLLAKKYPWAEFAGDRAWAVQVLDTETPV